VTLTLPPPDADAQPASRQASAAPGPAANAAVPLRRLRLMTYNTHGCVGLDGACRPERIAALIARFAPDVVALQEVDVGLWRSGSLDQARRIADLTGLSPHFTSARNTGGGHYGNAILTHHPYELRAEGILPVRSGEVRAAQWLRLSFDDGYLDVVNTHLSLHFLERIAQFRALFSDEPHSAIGTHPAPFPPLRGEHLGRLVLCGDFNAGALSPLYFLLRRRLRDAQRARGRRAEPTFPSRYPLLRIDHVWLGAGLQAESVLVPRDALARIASDHLPIVVDLSLTPLSSGSAARQGEPPGMTP
jgi:endonuclease/exonuclease/phosphatase family metal-dependent hydrolase